MERLNLSWVSKSFKYYYSKFKLKSAFSYILPRTIEIVFYLSHNYTSTSAMCFGRAKKTYSRLEDTTQRQKSETPLVFKRALDPLTISTNFTRDGIPLQVSTISSNSAVKRRWTVNFEEEDSDSNIGLVLPPSKRISTA